MYTNNDNLFILFVILFLFVKNASGQSLEIWEIQGDSLTSPYVNQVVATNQNIVTFIDFDGFFMQTPGDRDDNDPNTSNGIKVITGATPTFVSGLFINVSGTVREINQMTVITNPSVTIDNPGEIRELPEPVSFDENFPNKTNIAIPDLEKVEGMRIQFDALVTSPSNFTNEVTLTTQLERPFREPGVKYPGISGFPVWDGNPELFWFDPNRFDQNDFGFVHVGMRIASNEAVMVSSDERYYALSPDFRITGSTNREAVREKTAEEISIASLNMLQFKEEEDFYSNRIDKFAQYIVELLRAPDIIAVQEVGGREELEALTTSMARNYQIEYQVYFETGNDGIHVAFLVGKVIQQATLEQYFKNELLGNSPLHDRPPLLLKATVPTNPPSELLVLNLHLRSRREIENSERANFVRTKRFEQSKDVAELVQSLQGENLIVVGDFNAFEFTDGYVDVVNQISGEPSLGALFPPQTIVSPSLSNLTTALLPEQERYSFVFEGNAELLDHCITNDLPDFEINALAFARGNADNSTNFFPNRNSPLRCTDHDGFVLFLEPNNPLTSVAGKVNVGLGIKVHSQNPIAAGGVIALENPRALPVRLELFNVAGQSIQCFPNTEKAFNEISLSTDILPGIYWLKVSLSSSGLKQSFSLVVVE